MVDYKGFQETDQQLQPKFSKEDAPLVEQDDADKEGLQAEVQDVNQDKQGADEQSVDVVLEAETIDLSGKSVYRDQDIRPQKTPKKRHVAGWVAVIMVAAMLAGTMTGVGYYWAGNLSLQDGSSVAGAYYLDASSVKRVKADYGISESIPDMVDRLGGAVVSITSQMVQNDFFFNEYEASGSGTGVIFNINKDSVLIVTNNHVIEDATSLNVAFNRETSAKAIVVGTDPDADIAVIKVALKDLPQSVLANLPTVVFGDSDKIRVGEMAIAIGNPLGYDDTVTVGVVSGIDRSLRLSGRNFNLIQTDAAINPGNSGGALFNGKGEVIGINTVKIADQEVEGIGFAIPINTVKPLIQEILQKGYVSKPYLGIAGQDINSEISETYGIPVGVMVSEVVPGSGAAKAGLVKGDVITKVDGKQVDSMEALIDIISSKKVGDSITLEVKGENKSVRTVKAVLGDRNKQ